MQSPILPDGGPAVPARNPTAGSRLILATALIFLVSLIGLGWGVTESGIAAPYTDPLAHIRAQDESVYVSSAIRMERSGDWLTPRFLGRLFLFKPPLLLWVTATSIRAFGLTLFAVRLPSLLFGAAGTAACFAWCANARSVPAAFAASALIVLSPFWQSFARLCFTDTPAVVCAALALLCVTLDPGLRLRRTRILFGFFAGASILTKSVAGLLPCVTLLAYAAAMPRAQRPRFRAILEAGLSTVAVVAPWPIYQAVVHPNWFWVDFVQVQLLGIGLQNGGGGQFGAQVTYYLGSLVRMDATVAVLGLFGVAGSLRVARLRQSPAALLAAVWGAVTLVALLTFQAKNLPYVLFLVPPLCILGAVRGPSFLDRPAVVGILVALIALVKIAALGEPWSVRPFAPPIPGAQAMRMYYSLARDTDLFLVDTDDQFYSATLPLPRLRYCFIDNTDWGRRTMPHYVYLGIILRTGEFLELPPDGSPYRERLSQWGLASIDAVATTLMFNDRRDLNSLLRARPDSDFYLPSSWLTDVADAGATHDVLRFSPDYVFLLSRSAVRRRPSLQQLPDPW